MFARACALIAIVTLMACGTLRPLPERTAGDAADRLIASIWGTSGGTLAEPPLEVQRDAGFLLRSADIDRLRTQMENRSSALQADFAAGLVGLTNDGYVEARDISALDLTQRDALRDRLAHENADRAALYRELASLNRQPQWQTPLGVVFAQHWQRAAAPGWWCQMPDGSWQPK